MAWTGVVSHRAAQSNWWSCIIVSGVQMPSPASPLPSQLRQSWYLGWRGTEENNIHWVHSVCCGSRWSSRAILLPSSLPSWFWKDWDVHWTLNWTSWRQLSHCSSKLQLLPSNRLLWLLPSPCGGLPVLSAWELTQRRLKVRSHGCPRDVAALHYCCLQSFQPSLVEGQVIKRSIPESRKNLHNWTFPTHCTVLRANVLW